MRQPDLVLRFRGFRRGREEGDKVPVLDLGLRQARGAPLLVVGVRDGKLGFGQVFTVGVGVDEGVQGQAAHIITTAGNLIKRTLEENLVGLVGIGNLFRNQFGFTGTAPGQSKQGQQATQPSKPVHFSFFEHAQNQHPKLDRPQTIRSPRASTRPGRDPDFHSGKSPPRRPEYLLRPESASRCFSH